MSYIYSTLHNTLGLGAEQAPRAKSGGRTARQYRRARRKEKMKAEAPSLSLGSVSFSDGFASGRSRNLWSQTIVEEMDSDF